MSIFPPCLDQVHRHLVDIGNTLATCQCPEDGYIPWTSYSDIKILIAVNYTILSFDAEKEGERVFLVVFHVSPLELNRSLDSEPSVRILGNGYREGND